MIKIRQNENTHRDANMTVSHPVSPTYEKLISVPIWSGMISSRRQEKKLKKKMTELITETKSEKPDPDLLYVSPLIEFLTEFTKYIKPIIIPLMRVTLKNETPINAPTYMPLTTANNVQGLSLPN